MFAFRKAYYLRDRIADPLKEEARLERLDKSRTGLKSSSPRTATARTNTKAFFVDIASNYVRDKARLRDITG